MTGGKPDRIPVIPQICPPHAIKAAGMPYRETVVDRLRNPQKYDLLVPDCAVNYGADGFRIFMSAPPQNIKWQGQKAYSIEPTTGKQIGIVDFKGGGEVQLVPSERRKRTEADIEAIDIISADALINSPLIRPCKKAIEKYGDQYFIIGAPGVFTMESMVHTQGMERTLMDILDRPEFLKKWTHRNLQVSIQCAIAMAKLGVDAFYIGETFGQFLSPHQFEELCLPFFQHFVEVLRDYKPLIYLHMCGQVTHLLDLIPQTGVDCFEPLDEVAGTKAKDAKEKIGDKVALMGGVRTTLLAHGTTKEVKQDCERCIRDAGHGGGYILAACDMLPTETKSEKVNAMIETAETFGSYD